jgi:hypothetical protein
MELSFGPLVWFAHLSSLYAAATLFCLDRWRGTRLLGLPMLELSIGLLTLVAAGLIVFALLRQAHSHNTAPRLLAPRFRNVVPPLLEVLSLIAIIWQAGAAMLAPDGCCSPSFDVNVVPDVGITLASLNRSPQGITDGPSLSKGVELDRLSYRRDEPVARRSSSLGADSLDVESRTTACWLLPYAY